MSVRLPESVFRYLTDPTVQAGVEAVLDHGVKKVPPGLTWSELAAYSRAALAATTVQTDWLTALASLWEGVWSINLPGWRPLTLEEQNAAGIDAEISIQRCWTEEWYGRCFTRQATLKSSAAKRAAFDSLMCLSISLSTQGVAIGISSDHDSLDSLATHGFLFDRQDDTWWSRALPIDTMDVDLSILRDNASVVLASLHEL